MSLDEDDDTVFGKFELSVVGIDVAGRFFAAFEVIPPVRAAEELLLKGSLEHVAADFQFYGAGGRDCAGKRRGCPPASVKLLSYKYPATAGWHIANVANERKSLPEVVCGQGYRT